jgi:hypothetical protein
MVGGPVLIYDPRNHDFVSWASLMVELYSAQNLEIPNERTDWLAWANGLKGIDVFANEGVPTGDAFDNWHDWAEALVAAVNPSIQTT